MRKWLKPIVELLAGVPSVTKGWSEVGDEGVPEMAEEAIRRVRGTGAVDLVLVVVMYVALSYGPTTGLAKPDELRAPEASDIDAFEYKPIDGPAPTAAIVSCAAIAPACVHTAELIQAYLAKLDIDSDIVHSDYTPAGNQRAMNTALSKDPTAIFTIAVSPSTVGPQIKRAKAEDIFVIDAVGTEETDGGDLDAYVPQGSNLFQIALAAQLALSIEGKGAVTWLDAPAFPELEVRAGTDFFMQVCPGCTLTEDDVTAAQVTNPVTMGSLITSLMRAKPDTAFVTLASACADLQSAAAALRRTKGKLAAPGCGAAAIAAMNAGNLQFASGTVEPWGALAAIDPELARQPSAYGHDFARPPGLRHALGEWTTRIRPIALRQAILSCRSGGTVSVAGVYGGFIDKWRSRWPEWAIAEAFLAHRRDEVDRPARAQQPAVDLVDRQIIEVQQRVQVVGDPPQRPLERVGGEELRGAVLVELGGPCRALAHRSTFTSASDTNAESRFAISATRSGSAPDWSPVST